MIELANRGHHRCGGVVPPATRSKHPGPMLAEQRTPEVKVTVQTKRGGQRVYLCTLTRSEWLALDDSR